MDAHENTIFTAVLIIALVLGFIIAYFFISIVNRQRKNLQLYKKNILAEITQIEKERSRIAADLHDELGPLLSAVKLKINSFELSDTEDKIQIIKTNNHIDEILKRVRGISFDLMPNSLLRKGLASAVKEFVEYLRTSTGIIFNLHLENDIRLGEQNEINTYRIIQEIINNTIKHSLATELTIHTETVKNILVLTVKDNGIGFDTRASEENIGLGLRSLLRRTEIMNGQMFLESQKEKGTTFIFEIPLS